MIDDLADRIDGVDGDATNHESVLDGFTDFGVLSVDRVVDRVDRMDGDDTTALIVVAGSSLSLSSSSSSSSSLPASSSFLSDVLDPPLPFPRRYNLSRSLLPRLFLDVMEEGLSDTDRAVVFNCEVSEDEDELDVKVLSVTVVEFDRGDFLSLSLPLLFSFFVFDFLVGLLLLLLSVGAGVAVAVAVAVASDVRSKVRSNDFVTDSRTADFRLRRSLSFSSTSFRLFRADCGVEWAET